MLVITGLGIGPITFILRVIIQVFSYGGLFLIGYIVLASAPQVASLKTHDVLNRVVGKETATKSIIAWVYGSLRGRNGDPIKSKRLLLSLVLSSVYTLLVTLTDVGFLGFYACKVSSGSFFDRPASAQNSSAALAVSNTSLVTGTKASAIQLHRCDATKPYEGGWDFNVCSSWQNTTFLDSSTFVNINTTDSDLLLPRFLRNLNHSRADTFPLNSYHIKPGPKLQTSTNITNGIAVEPHDGGFRAVFGVPNLSSGYSVALGKNLALEVEFGCMGLGIWTGYDPDGGNGFNIYSENTEKFRKYSGPENMREVLLQTTEEIRAYHRPLYQEELHPETQTREGINKSASKPADVFSIKPYQFPSRPDMTSTQALQEQGYLMGNCTERLRKKLGVDKSETYMATLTDKRAPMCSVVSLNGPDFIDGTYALMATTLVCASSTQINMVSGTITKEIDNKISFNITRLPSTLNQLRAEYFEITTKKKIGSDETVTEPSLVDPILRYTLSDDPNGELNHYIYPLQAYTRISNKGTASAGNALARVASAVIDIVTSTTGAYTYMLTMGEDKFTTDPTAVTRWAGRVGGSVISNSVTMNGLAAQMAQPVLVTNIGGIDATCYRTPYAVSFIPLALAVAIIIAWMALLFTSGSLSGGKKVQEFYGGLRPYWGIVCPNLQATDAILSWENYPDPHLALVQAGQVINVHQSEGTAARVLASGTGGPSPGSHSPPLTPLKSFA